MTARRSPGRAAEAREVGAGLIVVAGDPVARTLLVRELGTDLAAITVTIEREVSADSDEAARAADEAVAQQVAQRSRERFEHWRTQLAHDHGVQDPVQDRADAALARSLTTAVHPARGAGHQFRSPAGRRRRGAAPAPGSRYLTGAHERPVELRFASLVI